MKHEADPSVADLFGHLAADVRELAKAEIAFVREQAVAYARGVAVSAAYFAAAAVLGMVAFLVLTAALVALVALAMPWPAAAAVVAVAYGVVAALCVQVARKQRRPAVSAELEAVAQHVKEDIEWTRMQAVSKMK